MSDTETIKGRVEVCNKNKFGFYGVKVGETWYSAGKTNPGIEKGDTVQFEAFENEKGFQTIKGKVKKVAGGGSASKASGGSKDEYWAKKDAANEAAQPRIVYMASRERAIAEVALYLQAGAFKMPVKQTDIFKVVQALIDDTTNRIVELSYAATVPDLKAVKIEDVEGEGEPEAGEEDEGFGD